MTLTYDYMPAVLYAIDLISQGYSETAAVDASNISIAILRKYIKASPELQDMYEEADQRGGDAMADALLNIDNHHIYHQSDPKMAKVISDNIKWHLSKRKAKKYGDKIEVNVNVTADRAIVDALNAGRQRAALAYAPDYIDGEFTTIEQTDEELMRQMLDGFDSLLTIQA